MHLCQTEKKINTHLVFEFKKKSGVISIATAKRYTNILVEKKMREAFAICKRFSQFFNKKWHLSEFVN